MLIKRRVQAGGELASISLAPGSGVPAVQFVLAVEPAGSKSVYINRSDMHAVAASEGGTSEWDKLLGRAGGGEGRRRGAGGAAGE